MIDVLSLWNILLVFEIILFASYTGLMYVSSRKNRLHENCTLPKVTIIIPMYNEEKIIQAKINNSSLLDYPGDKLNIILLDDHSNDNSRRISLEGIKQTSQNIEMIESQGNKGKANALNWIFPFINSDITVISDADAFLKEDSIRHLVNHYTDPDIGGATGKIVIISDRARISKSQEDSYRLYYDIWRAGESNIYSVSICNGPLMSFRTEILKKIKIDPDAYADDSDLLFKVIRSGYRVIYVPEAIVYEPVPLSLKGRTIQKMKRINGLRKVYFRNLDMLGKGIFGTIIYPFALLTHIVSPLIVLYLVLVYPFIVIDNPWYLGLLILLVLPGIGQTLLSFVITQFMMNFSFLIKTGGSWEAVEDSRYEIER